MFLFAFLQTEQKKLTEKDFHVKEESPGAHLPITYLLRTNGSSKVASHYHRREIQTDFAQKDLKYVEALRWQKENIRTAVEQKIK